MSTEEEYKIAHAPHLYRVFRRHLLSGTIPVIHKRVLFKNKSVLVHMHQEERLAVIKSNLPDDVAGVTLGHELLHDHYPKYPEDVIEQAGIEFYKQLGPRRRAFLKTFAQNKHRLTQ